MIHVQAVKGDNYYSLGRRLGLTCTGEDLARANGYAKLFPDTIVHVPAQWLPAPVVDDTVRDGWTLVHDIDFAVDDGYEVQQTWQSNDASYNLRRNAIFGDGGLRLMAKRETFNGFEFTTADVLGRHKPVGNYFRAEFAAELPIEYGQWPALWFRPTNSADGEIDVCETWPAFWSGNPTMQVTLHSEYGPTHQQANASLAFSMLPNPDPAAEHVWMVEKTPGRIRFECDGVLIREWNQTNLVASLAGWWDRIFEAPDRGWYPRMTTQMGGQYTPDPLPGWQESVMVVRSLRLWEPTRL